MASTNKTTYYDLSQYIANDKPTYLTDYNNDMSAIDGAIHDVDVKATTAGTKADSADGKADNATLTANTALTNAGTANTNIGNMANLETTEKSNLVGAINEVEGNVEKFNLTNFSSYSGDDIVVTGGTLTVKNGILRVATNSDGSIFKFYTDGLILGYSGSGNWKLTISTSVRPTSELVIAGGMKFYESSDRHPIWVSGVSFTVKTNGNIEISISKDLSLDEYQLLYFPPCLYFAKDFGDTPSPTPNI